MGKTELRELAWRTQVQTEPQHLSENLHFASNQPRDSQELMIYPDM
jgi:hypothetical protein